MRFPLFADELRSADPAKIHWPNRVQKLGDLLAPEPLGPFQLPLRKPLQKTGASRVRCGNVGIDPLEQSIGN